MKLKQYPSFFVRKCIICGKRIPNNRILCKYCTGEKIPIIDDNFNENLTNLLWYGLLFND